MRRYVTLVASATILMMVAMASPAGAICAYQGPAEQFAGADVVFEGTAEPGPTTNGMLLSPAAFTVDHHLKGQVRGEARVTTGVSTAGDGLTQMISTGITPRAGERWRIYATTAPGRDVLITSDCHGSHRLDVDTAASHPGEEPVGADDHAGTPPAAPARSWQWSWIAATVAAGIVTSAAYNHRRRAGHSELP